MDLNKERIEKLAKLMYDGIGESLEKADKNFTFNPVEWTIALSSATKVALLNSLKIMKVREKMAHITDEQLIDALGDMMHFSIDKNIEIAQRNEQA